MNILSTEDILKEARKNNPEIPDSVEDKIKSFLKSELNEGELGSVALKQIVQELLDALTVKKSEN
jgi:hypothetical protein